MTLKCVVIGAGWFGRAHCRVYRDLKDARLVAVADGDYSRAGEVAELYDCKAYNDFHKMLDNEKPDVVSVVVSPQNLSDVASEVVDFEIKGALIEKPVGTNLEAVADLSRKSRRNGVIVMPGFIELFNPCIQRLEEIVTKGEDIGQPYVASSKRIGRNPKRGWEIGVLLDLGIHEIYVFRRLFGSPRKVFCQAKSFAAGGNEDVANLLLQFNDGPLGIIETNWITPIGIRSMIVTGSEGSVEADYMTQELRIIKKEHTIKPHYVFEEPLKRELTALLECIEKGNEPPVNLKDAEETLKVALAAMNSSKRNEVITV
jgi:UDP-N-acetylglucosamine 3-dehydrogenase